MNRISRRFYAICAIVLAAIIFVALNIAADAGLTTARLDLTQNGAFTLSRGTRSIIKKIQEPIVLKFYYSKGVAADYAQIRAYAGQVRDLLHEYASLSHGKIILEEIDPEPFTPAEDQAVAAGLTGAPTDSGDMVYFGLEGTNSIDGKQSIAFFTPDRAPYLEYDLTSLLYRLETPKKPVLGIISGLPLAVGPGGMMAAVQGHSQPFAVYQELEQSYSIKTIDPGFTSLPAGIDALMIVDPPTLNDAQLFAIDQYVLHGGHTLVFVDPLSEVAGQGGGITPQSGSPQVSDLPRLFKAWGVHYDPKQVVADMANAQHVQVAADPRNPVAEYPAWLHLTPEDFDSRDPVTANLQSLNLASVGALMPAEGATTHFAPLIHSSDRSALLPVAEVRANQTTPQELMSFVRPTGQEYTIAARVSGPATSAFPNGLPNAPKTAHAPLPLKQSLRPINVVVMADSDIFDDRFWIRPQNVYGKTVDQPFADNGAFVLNAVGNLIGSDDLVSLRTRASADRPFTVVQQIQAEAQAKFQSEADVLKQKLSDTEDRLKALQQGAGGSAAQGAGLTAAQKKEIDRFRSQLLETRTQLRQVQHNLRKNIDRLGQILAFINIALVPLLVACFAIVLALLRRRRRVRALKL